MSVRISTYCDRESCTTHAAAGMDKAAGFLVVEWHGEYLDFCSVDCLLVSMAARAPLTRVHGDASEERP